MLPYLLLEAAFCPILRIGNLDQLREQGGPAVVSRCCAPYLLAHDDPLLSRFVPGVLSERRFVEEADEVLADPLRGSCLEER